MELRPCPSCKGTNIELSACPICSMKHNPEVDDLTDWSVIYMCQTCYMMKATCGSDEKEARDIWNCGGTDWLRASIASTKIMIEEAASKYGDHVSVIQFNVRLKELEEELKGYENDSI